MSSSARRKPASPRPVSQESDGTWLVGLAAIAILVVGLLMAKAAGASWLSWEDSSAGGLDAPHWLTTDTVRATAADGAVVKAKVVLDAPDHATRTLLGRQAGQVQLLMQVSVAEHDGAGATGGERVQRLAEDIHERLNDFLEAQRVPPVRDVVIQDLVVSRP